MVVCVRGEDGIRTVENGVRKRYEGRESKERKYEGEGKVKG